MSRPDKIKLSGRFMYKVRSVCPGAVLRTVCAPPRIDTETHTTRSTSQMSPIQSKSYLNRKPHFPLLAQMHSQNAKIVQLQAPR